MNSWKRFPRFIVIWLTVLATAGLAAAQSFGRLDGEVKDQTGKPFPGVVIEAKHSERELSQQTTTDEKGRYVFRDIFPGVWKVTFKAKDPNSGQLVVFFEGNVRVPSGGEQRLDVSLKDIIAARSAEEKEEIRKREADRSKFEGMKGHFDAGRAAMDQIRATREEIRKAPPDQRAALQEKLNPLVATAVSEFEQARDTVDPKDPNVRIVMENLGQAYEEAGRYDDAAAAYTRAIEVSPQTPQHYTQLGTVLGRAAAEIRTEPERKAKVDTALAACENGAKVNPAEGAVCFRNVSIVLYNKSHLKEAVLALRRSTVLDPNNADQWYLLAASLLASAESKTEGGKLVTVFAPGTAEAYQRYLELAPNGRYAAEAKASLDALAQMGAGIDTKVKGKKSKP
jgi:tetratricopeptide (TPR) repeat protein